MSASTQGWPELLEAIPLPATLIDADGIVLAINQAFIDYALSRGRQVRREERVGRPVVEYAGSGPEREAFEGLVREVLGQGVPRSYRWESSRRDDGRRVYVDIRGRPIRSAAGALIGAVILRDDVTERTLQDQQWLVASRVREAVWRMRDTQDIDRVLAVMREGLAELEVPFDFCGVNLVRPGVSGPTALVHSMTHDGQTAAAASGPSETDVVAQIWRGGRVVFRRDLDADDPFGERARLHADYGQPIRSVLDVPFSHGTLAVNSGQPEAFTQEDIALLEGVARVLSEGYQRLDDLRHLEEQYRRLDEVYRKERQNLAALERANQQLQREIDTRRRAEEELRQAQKMEAVGQLTAGVAHNFNNLLQAVIGNLELALREAPPELQPLLRAAESAAERGADIVRQLMVFAYPKQARGLGPVALGAVVSECAGICQRTFGPSIDLVVELTEHLPPVTGHRGYLEQALLNLLLNARDAVAETGGRIRMVVDVVTPTPAQLQLHPEVPARNHLRLQVIDDGRGMDEETRRRVFEPFFTTKEVGKGTGLGLATVYAIVREHQGWIECDSAPGQGTTFAVFLPVAVEPAPAASRAEPAAVTGGTETVLIVDDEEMVRSVSARLLERMGYRALAAEDGARGLELFRRNRGRIGAVLLDLGLPGHSGGQVLTDLLQLDPRAKVIVFTGYAVEPEDCAGARAVLHKPIEWSELLRVLRQVLDT